MIGKFEGERIGVWSIDVGIPPHGEMAPGVRHRRRVFIGLDEDLRSVAADDGEKGVSIRLLEFRLEAKLVAVKGDGSIDVTDDEEWGNRLRCRLRHKRKPTRYHRISSRAPLRAGQIFCGLLSVAPTRHRDNRRPTLYQVLRRNHRYRRKNESDFPHSL